MRKILTVFLVVSLFVMIFAPAAMAQDESVEAGLTPDSPFYFLKQLVEKIQYMFTFGAENKVELLNRFGEKRLAEAQKMIEKGKTDLVEGCLNRYQEHLKKAQGLAENLDNEEVCKKVTEATSKHMETLNGLLEKAPERARGSIEQAVEVSQTGCERAIEALQKKIQIQEHNEGEESEIRAEQQTRTQEMKEDTGECEYECECEQTQEQNQEHIQEEIKDQTKNKTVNR